MNTDKSTECVECALERSTYGFKERADGSNVSERDLDSFAKSSLKGSSHSISGDRTGPCAGAFCFFNKRVPS